MDVPAPFEFGTEGPFIGFWAFQDIFFINQSACPHPLTEQSGRRSLFYYFSYSFFYFLTRKAS